MTAKSGPFRAAATIFLMGWAIFLASAILPKAFAGALASPPWLGQVILKTVLLAVSLAAMRHRGGPWSDYGFRRPQGVRWLPTIGFGATLGAAASFAILASGGKGLSTIARSYGPIAFVLVIWLYSSITEEIFTRGWAQSSLAQWDKITVLGLPLPVLTSGLLFGSMHLSLIWAGADAPTCILIPIFTTLLGFWAGSVRARSGSLLPATVAHIAFNVGSPFGGILWMLLYLALHGKPPVLGN